MKIYPIFYAQYLTKPLSFKGYYGDEQPAKKLYWNICHQNTPNPKIPANIIEQNGKRRINDYPDTILKRSAKDTIDIIMKLTGNSQIPSYIPTPYICGDNWGRYANYIEINPRLIAKYNNGQISDGLLQTLKIMTAIPPSKDNAPNCIILSQLYPSFNGDGTTGDETLYHANLHKGISKNLTARGLDYKMGDDEQVKAFNDLAHLMGFKTGIRMPISEGQLRVKGQDFSWYSHEKAYIDACVWAIELGFDAIYFDSAKHIIDMNGYCGIGRVPNKEQMAYILHTIRKQTGRTDLSFIGEKCTPDDIYRQMGFTAGAGWGDSESLDNIKYEIEKQKYSRYASGPEISNDNDIGIIPFETKLRKMDCILPHHYDRLPTFMQINDIFPLSPFINTHKVMTNVVQLKGSPSWTECEQHWDYVFRTDNQARDYSQKACQKLG